jgi:hypothetical protein
MLAIQGSTVLRLSILLLHVSALQERHLQGVQSILMKFCVCYVISAEKSERREWITVCVHTLRTISLGYFGLPEDGAAEAPKHMGARLIFEVYGLL